MSEVAIHKLLAELKEQRKQELLKASSLSNTWVGRKNGQYKAKGMNRIKLK